MHSDNSLPKKPLITQQSNQDHYGLNRSLGSKTIMTHTDPTDQFDPQSPPDSVGSNQRAEPSSQLGVRPASFSSSLFQAESDLCSEISTLEDGLLYGGKTGTKVVLPLKQRGLDNLSRETLLGTKFGYVALVIDGLLRFCGTGQRLTVRQAYDELKPLGIGRRTIETALHAAPAGRRLFNLAGIYKPKRGRRAQLYELPSADEVARRLNLPRTPSDDLRTADLHGLPVYRAALHRELIRRQPRQYTRGWLAARLGVSKRTVREYDKRADITVTPKIVSFPLRRLDLQDMADERKQDIPTHSIWLEHNGRRYPALKAVANRLMQLGGATLVKQYANYYEILAT